MPETTNISNNMQTCPTCGNSVSASAVMCRFCGHLFYELGDNPNQTVVVERPPSLVNPDEDTSTISGTSRFALSSVLYISIERMNTPISRTLRDKPIFIGRSDTTILGGDDIDLTPYNARDRGVSRRHAQIYYQEGEIYLEDLGSSNGTLVNGVPLSAHAPYKLRDGDEVILGKMMLWVNFS